MPSAQQHFWSEKATQPVTVVFEPSEYQALCVWDTPTAYLGSKR